MTRILVRGVNWLGDLVMSIPALIRLRERFPDAIIDLLLPQKLEGLVLGQPWVSSLIGIQETDSLWKVSRHIRALDYDSAIVFPNSTRSALEVFLAGVPHRIGYSGRGRTALLTQAIPRPDSHRAMRKRTPHEIKRLIESDSRPSDIQYSGSAHHIHQYLNLLRHLDCDATPLAPSLHVSEAFMLDVAGQFELRGDRSYLGMNPGAEYGPAKRWPEDRFIQAGAEIAKSTGCDILLLGGKADRPTTDRIHSLLKERVSSTTTIHNLAGRTTLQDLPAVMKRCRVVLTNDSGPMHIAAAVGVSVVVPFGSTSAELTGPGLPVDSRHAVVRAHAPCSPCFLRECPIDLRCMTGIDTSRIVEAVLKRF